MQPQYTVQPSASAWGLLSFPPQKLSPLFLTHSSTVILLSFAGGKGAAPAANAVAGKGGKSDDAAGKAGKGTAPAANAVAGKGGKSGDAAGKAGKGTATAANAVTAKGGKTAGAKTAKAAAFSSAPSAGANATASTITMIGMAVVAVGAAVGVGYSKYRSLQEKKDYDILEASAPLDAVTVTVATEAAN